MTYTIKKAMSDAFVWTAEQIEPGTGHKLALSIVKVHIDDMQKVLGRQSITIPRYAVAVEVSEDDPGGSEVSLGKTQSGIVTISSDAVIVACFMTWARTIVRPYELENLQAEPVTCSIKGQSCAAFRVIGVGLFAMNPNVAGRGESRARAQARIRDRIIAIINGEEQAGPDSRDIPQTSQGSVLRLMSLSSPSIDVRNPPLDTEARLALQSDEAILYEGQHVVEVRRNDPLAFRKPWYAEPAPTTPATVWITNRRVAVSCAEWSEDPSARQMIDRRRRAGFAESSDGRLVVAGHLTAPWISNIYTSRPGGSDERFLQFQSGDSGMPVRLKLVGIEQVEAERLMRQAAADVAAYRLATDATVTAEESETLKKIKDDRATPEDLDWARRIHLPSSYTIGRDPESADAG